MNSQTDMETVISYAWLPKETWLQIEERFAAAKSSWGERRQGDTGGEGGVVNLAFEIGNQGPAHTWA